MGTNDAAADALPVAACAAELLAAVSTGTGMLLVDEEELLQPAAKPARRASIAACATRRPRPSVIIPRPLVADSPPLLATIVADPVPNRRRRTTRRPQAAQITRLFGLDRNISAGAQSGAR
jgi:hypothetical protein